MAHGQRRRLSRIEQRRLRWARARLIDVLKRTDAGASLPHTGSASGCSADDQNDHMDTNTLLIIVLLVLLMGGGGFYYGRRHV